MGMDHRRGMEIPKWVANEPNNLDEDFLQTWGPSLDGNRAWNDNQFNENRNGYILEFGYFSNPNPRTVMATE